MRHHRVCIQCVIICGSRVIWYIDAWRKSFCAYTDGYGVPKPLMADFFSYLRNFIRSTKYSELGSYVNIKTTFPSTGIPVIIASEAYLIGDYRWNYNNGPVQDCSIASGSALEIPQSCTKPSIHDIDFQLLKFAVKWYIDRINLHCILSNPYMSEISKVFPNGSFLDTW